MEVILFNCTLQVKLCALLNLDAGKSGNGKYKLHAHPFAQIRPQPLQARRVE